MRDLVRPRPVPRRYARRNYFYGIAHVTSEIVMEQVRQHEGRSGGATSRTRLLFLLIAETLLVVAVLNAAALSHESSSAAAVLFALVVALGISWGVSLGFRLPTWLNIATDATAIFAILALVPDPGKQLVVVYGAVIYRSLDPGRRLSIFRPVLYVGAALAGAYVAQVVSEAHVQWKYMFVELMVIGAISATMTAIAHVIRANEVAIKVESTLFDLGTAISGRLEAERQGQLCATAVEEVLSLCGAGEARVAAAVRNDDDGFTWVTSTGPARSASDGDPFTAVLSHADQNEWLDHEVAARRSEIVSRCSAFTEICELPIYLSETHSIFPVVEDGKTLAAIAIGYSKRVPCEAARSIARTVELLGVCIQSREHLLAATRGEAERTRLLENLVRSREAERASLAGDLHDGPIQSLSATLFDIDYATALVEEGAIDEALSQITEIRRGVTREVAGMRRLMVDLLPPVLAQCGLAAALREHISVLKERNEKVSFAFMQEGTFVSPVSESIERTLYRLAQEAITNSLKHAGATEISVFLNAGSETAELLIADDGIGFDSSGRLRDATSGHFGLASMRQRMEMVGGDLTVESEPGAGSKIVASVPLVNASAEGLITSLESPLMQLGAEVMADDSQPGPIGLVAISGGRSEDA